METELWPTLIMNARKKGIRLKLVNGRLSPKTLNVPKLWRNLLAYLLTYQIGTCLLRSEQDKAYYIQLGVMPEKLQVTGNIKLCDESSQLLSQYYSASYIVFASTHEPEELQLARLWQQHPTLPKLVIVPRHPKRGKALVQVLSQAGILVSQRSVNPDQHKGIIIADTFGELLSWMAYSEMVIMGGSFAPKGGQNPIEPARLGKFIIAGADMHDFADEARALTQVGAMQSFPHIDESLIVYIKSLLKQPEQLVQKGALGRAWLLQTQQQVMTDTLIALGLDKS
jgi:3-deoxy-D-manno-octulosonic-acid transferase